MKCSHENSKSISLVKHIGIPNICKPILKLESNSFPTFLATAEKNKIPLLFLKIAASGIKNHNLQHVLSQYEQRHKNTLGLIAFTAKLLEKMGACYTFFKTLKPFPYTPSDVDVLLLSNENLRTIIRVLKTQGCIPLEKSAYGITMFCSKYKMNLDLTTEIAVSGLIYVDKESLSSCISRFEIDGSIVQTLKPSADLLVVGAHSIFKEQMFTLSDYYTFVMLTQYWKEATRLTKKFQLEYAFNTMLKMAEALTIIAFGSANSLMRSFEEVGVANAKEASVQSFELPKRYDIATLTIAFLKKIKDNPVSKKSLFHIAQSASHPTFYKKFLEHATRKTY